MAAGKANKIIVLALSILLGAAFIAAGAEKFTPEAVEAFEEWGFPAWFTAVIGVVELLGAALVLYPRTRFYGATLLACDMAGAVFTHIRADEMGMIGPPLFLLAIAGVVAWLRCPCGRKQATARQDRG